jgi:hypothetical protein
MSDLSAWLTELQAASPWDLDAADAAMPQWEEEPVPLDVFVGDARYLANPPLSDEQAEAVRYAERVYMPPAYLQLAQSADKDIRDYWGQPLRLVNFVTLQWGKGGGKDHICRIISMRVAYLLLCLPSPLLYYKLPPQDSIHLLNVASSAPQANNAFFKPMRRAVSRHGCWFEDRCEPLDGVIRYAKNVEAISGHSDAETQEGLNVLLGVADEIDAFKREEELARNRGAQVREATKSAESILNMLRTSGRTRFPEVFKNVRISYPRYKGSMIQVLTGRARKDNDEFGDVSRHYVSGPKATWEVNPRVTGKSVFAEDYRDDPILSEARYECNPSRAINPYFTNEAAIESCLVDAERPPLLVEYVPEKHPVTDPATGRLEIVTTWGTRFDFAAHLYPIQGAQYAMHADLALTNDRAGVTMSHVSRWDEIEVTGKDAEQGDVKVLEHRPRVKVDFSISFAADSAAVPPREIQIRWARDLCFELRRRGFAVRRFTFDGYQCLSGETQIPLLDGTTRTMAELEGSSPFWVYSIRDGRVVPGLCTRAWRTAFREDMVEVELDNGEKLRATSDHLFLLRDGKHRRAAELVAGDSLMPLYRRLRKTSAQSGEYEQVWHPEPDGSGKRWRFTHSMVSHYCYGPVPKGGVTHHKNLNERDNTPGNLVQMTNAAHSQLHRAMGSGKFTRLWADPEWRAVHTERLRDARKADGRIPRPRESDVTWEDICAAANAIEGPLTWHLVADQLGCSQDVLYSRLRAAGYSSWTEFKWSVRPRSYGALAQARHRERRQAQNHTVAAVRRAAPEAVYDLQVEEHHNFATAAGVFVHNSVDSMQILEAAGVETDRLSTDMDHSPWRTLRDLFNECRIEMYHHGRSPEEMQAGQEQTDDERLLNELFGLSKLPNGRIDHLAGGSKDLADSLACSVAGAVELGGMEDPDGKPAFPAQQDYGAPETPIPLPLGFIAPAGAGENGFGPEGVLSSPIDLGYYELGSFAEDYDASLNVVEEFTGPRRPD